MIMETTDKATALSESTVLLSLEIQALGNRSKVSSDKIKSDADREMLHVAKDLLQSDELVEISRHARRAREFVRSLSLPSLFRGGFYLVKIDAIDRIEAQLSTLVDELQPLVDRFVEAMPARVNEARARLGSLFDPSEYPSEQRARDAFRWSWRWVSIDTPGKLKSISSAIFNRERDKARVELESAVDELTTILRGEFLDVLHHLVERLTPGADGKAKIIRKSAVGNLQAFLDTFSLRDVTSDGELRELVAKVRASMSGVQPEALREDESFRDRMRADLGQLKSELDELITSKPARAFSLDD
jgi:ElaB/YqjD/DUF883 family membrane-anchored ribosome-binding protein